MRILIFGLCLLGLTGCSCEKLIKKTTANKRKITLLSCGSGSVIKEWECQCSVNTQERTASWVKDDGDRVKISGCYIVEEI